ncbi:hypothetical protein Bca52824_087290 [Brassica carinata]|uniref:Uncharacterized protein n=1 Tax=Brassica carinata TaxID=52824 RepID=A0A8X7PBP3_BRACI|nr:hypothetical protein Bca52824_087290 [Brassica carinata]
MVWPTARRGGAGRRFRLGYPRTGSNRCGFSSFDGMLHWAIVLNRSWWRSWTCRLAELMQIARSDLNNASLSLEDFHRETLTGHNDLVILFWVQSPSNLCYFGNMFQALTAINTLLQLKSIEPLILRDFCGLEGALERMKLQLEESMADEDKRDYPADVESLRGEMELIFRTKRGLL